MSSKITLINMGITFITVTFIFVAWQFMFGLASSDGYDIEGLDETIFNDMGDQSKVDKYINDTKTIQETQADSSAFDVIGQLLATAFSPVRTLIGGANFLITNTGKLLGYIGIPTIISDYVTGLITFIIGSIFLFAVLMGRGDKLQ